MLLRTAKYFQFLLLGFAAQAPFWAINTSVDFLNWSVDQESNPVFFITAGQEKKTFFDQSNKTATFVHFYFLRFPLANGIANVMAIPLFQLTAKLRNASTPSFVSELSLCIAFISALIGMHDNAHVSVRATMAVMTVLFFFLSLAIATSLSALYARAAQYPSTWNLSQAVQSGGVLSALVVAILRVIFKAAVTNFATDAATYYTVSMIPIAFSVFYSYKEFASDGPTLARQVEDEASCDETNSLAINAVDQTEQSGLLEGQANGSFDADNAQLQEQADHGEENGMTTGDVLRRARIPLVYIFIDIALCNFLYPGVISVLHGSASTGWFPVIALAMFNTGDALGKFLPRLWMPFNAKNQYLFMVVLAIELVVFLPLFLVALWASQSTNTHVNPSLLTSNAFAYTLTYLLPVYHGFFACCCFAMSPALFPLSHTRARSLIGQWTFSSMCAGSFLGTMGALALYLARYTN